MAKLDWELNPKQLNKRVSQWKDSTLIRRLEKLTGKPLYTKQTKKKMRRGTFHLSPRVRTQLENRYKKTIKRATPDEKDRLLPKSSWMRVEQWLQLLANKDESLNQEFSFSRLIARGMFWVYRRGNRLAFANKKISGKVVFPVNVPQYVVYTIFVEDTEGIETWVQVSAPNFYYGDPFDKDAQEQGQDVVDDFQEENERAGSSRPSAHRYSWWAQNAIESIYSFLGLGVTFT